MKRTLTVTERQVCARIVTEHFASSFRCSHRYRTFCEDFSRYSSQTTGSSSVSGGAPFASGTRRNPRSCPQLRSKPYRGPGLRRSGRSRRSVRNEIGGRRRIRSNLAGFRLIRGTGTFPAARIMRNRRELQMRMRFIHKLNGMKCCTRPEARLRIGGSSSGAFSGRRDDPSSVFRPGLVWLVRKLFALRWCNGYLSGLIFRKGNRVIVTRPREGRKAVVRESCGELIKILIEGKVEVSFAGRSEWNGHRFSEASHLNDGPLKGFNSVENGFPFATEPNNANRLSPRQTLHSAKRVFLSKATLEMAGGLLARGTAGDPRRMSRAKLIKVSNGAREDGVGTEENVPFPAFDPFGERVELRQRQNIEFGTRVLKASVIQFSRSFLVNY